MYITKYVCTCIVIKDICIVSDLITVVENITPLIVDSMYWSSTYSRISSGQLMSCCHG